MKNFRDEMIHNFMRNAINGLFKGCVTGTGFNMNINMFGIKVRVNQMVEESSFENLDTFNLTNMKVEFRISINETIYNILRDEIINKAIDNAVFHLLS